MNAPTAPRADTPASARPRHLVLLGAGPTHRRLVRRLARQALPVGLQATWLVPRAQVLAPECLAAAIGGELDWAQATVALAPLAERAGVRLLVRAATGVDATARHVALDGHEHLAFDLLSVDPEPAQDRAAMEVALPGAREHALFTCPTTALAELWPRVQALPDQRLRSIALVGAGPLALELAFALRAARPGAALSLVSAGADLLPGAPAPVRAAATQALRRAGIDLLPARPSAIEPGRLHLDATATLACDMALLACGLAAPAWLAASGLPVAQADPLAAVATPAPGALEPSLQAPGWDGVYCLPPQPAPQLAARHLANLRRRAARQAPRPLGRLAPAWQAIWTAPGRALAYGAHGHLAGRAAGWLWRWQLGR